MTWHLAAAVFAAFGIGADYGSTLAALRVPGIREGNPIVSHMLRWFGLELTEGISVGIVLVLLMVDHWSATAVMFAIGIVRVEVALRNAEVVRNAAGRKQGSQ